MKRVIVFLLLAAINAHSQIPANGLVAYYPFNSSAKDSSGNGNNGTVYGASLTTDRFGNLNSAYNFNGTSNYMDCGNGSSLQIANDITIAAWIKSGFSNDESPEVASKYGTNSAGWVLSTFPDSTASFEGRDGVDYRRSGRSPKLNGSWHFLVGQRSGSVWKIFVDGILSNQTDVGTTGSMVASNNLQIGCQSGIGQRFFKGAIDDIRIYNRALSPTEIQSVYHEGGWASAPTTGLVAWYPFNGNAKDSSGNGNNGTAVGSITWGKDRFDGADRAAVFNGTTSYVNVDSSSTLAISGDITVSAWVKADTMTSGSCIVEKYYRNTLSDHGWLLQADGSGKAFFEGRDGSGGGNTIKSGFGAEVDNNKWHHVVGQRAGSVWKIYVDTVLSNQFNASSTGSINSGGPLAIGAYLNTTPVNGVWKGSMDDIRIYNRALNGQEIFSLYQERPTGVATNRSTPPEGYFLSQNYPNPFNPSTTIEYQIPRQSFVTLKVFDVLGREVATLANEKKDAGDYLLRFDASGLGSGVYFYRLHAGDFTLTRRLLLLK